MFENLGNRLQDAIHKIKGYGKITEDNISDIIKEVRIALLEADVNYKVVKEFVANVKEKALGTEVNSSLKPAEVFLKILKDELTSLLGTEKVPLVNNKFNVVRLQNINYNSKYNNLISTNTKSNIFTKLFK